MKLLIPIIAAATLSACQVAEQAIDVSTGALATGIDAACQGGMTPLAVEARRELVREINEKTTIGNHTPSDCDNDGVPDFNIDANGIPIP